jgi:hypothetical protein
MDGNAVIIESPADWRGPEIAARQDWIHRFTAAEIAELDAAHETARRRGKTLATLTAEDFPLPTLRPVLSRALEALENGPGIQHFRGFPALDYSKEALRLIYWGIGKHLGTAVSQSKDGDLLGDVRDFGVDIRTPTGRGYRSRQELVFHADSCDVVGLMVLRTAREGGLSKVASSVAVHNEIARRRPDLLEALYRPFYWSWQGQEASGDPPFYLQPIFSRHLGRLSCRYIRAHIESAQRFPEVPRLTPEQIEAMDLLDAIIGDESFHLSMMFEPGDIQFLNNHVCLHARTAFEDWPEPDRKRHLLRMWLSVANSRELSPLMSAIYRDRRPGVVRGGFPSRTGSHRYETPGGAG